MKLFKEHGVNPLGGCLPVLLQMPLLFALFRVFRSTIELRGAPFVLWIKDLSSPDTILQLPFTIPIYGDHVAVLPIIMGVTMFIQQKMMPTQASGQQKFMSYFMTGFFLLLFNQFPSGLNLYYTLFNVLTILQQKFLTPAPTVAVAPTKSKKMKTSDTIVAPATPFGLGGLAIIRLSGPRALPITANLCNESHTGFLKPRYATLVNVHDGEGLPFDECIATYFPRPNSYTGEDSVEISCHGSPVIVQQVVNRCRLLGARLAEPGEFTQRAFLNGRIDLVQAESVSALIHSQSEISSRLNYRLLQGALSEQLQHLQKKLIETIAHVEYELDISEAEFTPELPKKNC